MRPMRLAAALSAVLLAASSYPVCARADGPTVTPNVNVQPIPQGGVVVTPSATANIPLSPNASLQVTGQAAIVVPPSGPPVVVPSANVGAVIHF